MRQSSFTSPRGFVFHAVCYSLLQAFFHPIQVPLARLLEVCRSCPLQSLGLSWGHDYGGIVSLRNRYPGEERYLNFTRQPTLHQHQRAEPWDVQVLRKLLQGAQLSLLKKQKLNSTKSIPMNGAVPNRFTKLPLEILGYVVTYLPTDDARSLARTSRELAMIIPSGLGPSFWASRFRILSELDFVFKAQTHRDGLDWRSLYFGVIKAMHRSSGLQNRKRIWNLIRRHSQS